MKYFYKKNIIVFTALLYLLAGCSEDFLNENLSEVYYPSGLSNIYVSPGWASSDYQFSLTSVSDADFEITFKPSWLKINSLTGRINNGIADVECSASRNPDLEKVGIYVEYMMVTANGIDYKVPVYYVVEGMPVAQIQSTLLLSYTQYDPPSLGIMNTGDGILFWDIKNMPDWLVLDTGRLDIHNIYIAPNSESAIPLRIKPITNTGILTGKIILSTNDKTNPAITVDVTADLGIPQLSLNTSQVNLGFESTPVRLIFSNLGNGILAWEIEDMPEWLTINQSCGTYGPFTFFGNVFLECVRTKLSPGRNIAVIKLMTNDSDQPSSNITVIAYAPGNNENFSSVDGNIADAVFDKQKNILYFVTSTPNKFVSYNVTSRTVLNEIPLSSAPTSFAISEDWTKAAVGHNGLISAINLSNNTVMATYEVDYAVNDIAWGESDWFSFTQYGGSLPRLHWINTFNGTKYDDPDVFRLDGMSIIKKVPGQAYLIATRLGSSPSGFFAYDIPSKSIKSYSHMNLSNFWFSENGEYVLSTDLNVYRTSSSTGSSDTFDTDINPVGKINSVDQIFWGLQYLYQNNNYLWLLKKTSLSADATTLCQFKYEDYSFVRDVYYDLLYQPDAQVAPYYLIANYVFVNKNGTEIILLSKVQSNSSWVIQFVPLSGQ